MPKIDAFFKEMKERGASDLHLVVDFPPMLRLRGELVPIDHAKLTAESNRELIFEILTPQQQDEVKNKRDFDMSYEIEGLSRFRCNMFFQHRGISAVFRIIPTKIMKIEELNLPPVVKKIAEFKKGLGLWSPDLRAAGNPRPWPPSSIT